MKSIITQAGKFPVRQVSVHHSEERVPLDKPRTGVLHTTEGHWQDGFNILSSHYSPHFMLGYREATKKVEIVQFVPINFIGAALKAGGHHNADAIVQIEMVGFSDEKLWLPEQDTLDALCSLFNVCEYEWGIPLSHPWPDGDYGMAGFHTKHRGSGKFGKVAGWFGHGDVPDNDHWDPGNLRWSKVFARCHELQAAELVA
jgi:hypothetical protein